MATRNGFSVTRGSDPNSVNSSFLLGETKYTVIMYCPILSHIAVAAGTHLQNHQASGLVVLCADAEDSPVRVSQFFGFANTASTDILGTPASNYSMAEVCGYSSTANLESFMYSSHIDFRMVVPQANLTGTYYKGQMRLSQLFDGAKNDSTDMELQLGDLIRAANEVHAMKPGFSLQSAVVNDYILTHTLKNASDTITGVLNDSDLGAEIVDYVVLQQPAINITTGENSSYSLISEVLTNSIVVPSASDLLLYRTFNAITHHKQAKEIDYSYSPVNPETLSTYAEKVGLPSSYDDLDDFEKSTGLSEAQTPSFISERMPRLSDLVSDSDKTVVLQTINSNGKLQDVSPDFMSRRSAALRRFLHQHRVELEQAGVQLPLELGPLLPVIRQAGMFLIKEALTNEQLRHAVMERLNKARQIFESTKGQPVATRLKKAIVAGVTNTGTKAFKKAQNNSNNAFRRGMKLAKEIVSGKFTEDTVDEFRKLLQENYRRFSRVKTMRQALEAVKDSGLEEGIEYALKRGKNKFESELENNMGRNIEPANIQGFGQ